MSIICSYPSCPNIANMECMCREQQRLCESHMKRHSIEAGCYFKPFGIAVLLVRVKLKQNALVKLRLESIKLAKRMTAIINKCLKKNLAILKEKKMRIRDLVFMSRNAEAEKIVNSSRGFNFDENRINDFELSAEDLFCIDENSANKVSEFQRFKLEIDSLKKSNESANKKITEQERELCVYKKLCDDKKNEVEAYRRKYEESCKHIHRLEKDVEDWGKKFEEYHEMCNSELKIKDELLTEAKRRVEEGIIYIVGIQYTGILYIESIFYTGMQYSGILYTERIFNTGMPYSEGILYIGILYLGILYTESNFYTGMLYSGGILYTGNLHIESIIYIGMLYSEGILYTESIFYIVSIL